MVGRGAQAPCPPYLNVHKAGGHASALPTLRILKRDEIRFECSNEGAALPLPLAAEGWGGGVSASENPFVEKTLTRRFAPTSPASGRGCNARGQSIQLKAIPLWLAFYSAASA